MAETVADLTAAVNAALSKLSPTDDIPDGARMQLLDALDKLRGVVEPPIQSLLNICWSAHPLIAIRTAIGMGIFDAFAAAGGAELTVDELNEKTKGDKDLLVRIMRLLSANRLFTETGVDKYQPQPMALGFATGAPPSEVALVLVFLERRRKEEQALLTVLLLISHTTLRATTYTPEFLEARGYQSPDDAYDTPFQRAFGTKLHHFEWLAQHPDEQHAFNTVMETGNRTVEGEQWYDFYPWEERLASDADRVLLVDIGGGKGHDLARFKEKKNPAGRLIVQDLPEVIQDIQAPHAQGIEAQGYSMFDPQPVRGAKAYYMRTVLHDWPDKQALQALQRIREAMAEDSVLLINENTVPETGVPRFSASVDLIMMSMFSSLERTEMQWLSLLERAQFKVVKVWRADNQGVGSNAFFEAVPV
ncbi:S-adenosyl-L-methionine-dependent methyltransferase [Penicillium hispanicum]|uniref:S-adenosyl-L-methionine-dependent methyltransferase n=1 Tax=Penicillium hispanicum TaxID=1080232 RepID=UPI00253F7726|nr:S-adenosyl-L-methionine-dependent methyltransferase [Penicillium hispanicum]KAJ5586890.1 S-adenosyl-L-methionine-dependent methyltransferase [Penicillium hispanicum]